jgi:hypothetical protein
MNKAILFGMALLLAACGTQQNRNNETTPDAQQSAFFTREERVPYNASSTDNNSPALTFSMRLPQPSQATSKALTLLYGNLSPADYADKVFQEYKDNYKATRTDNSPTSWEYKEDDSITVYGNIAALTRARYVYTGGANGGDEKAAFVYDTKQERQIMLNDVVAQNAAFDDLVRASLKEQKDITFPPDTDFPFKPTDNFSVSPSGLTLIWQPVTIAPHSAGIVEVTLAPDALAPLLTPYGKTLFDTIGH